MYDSNYFRAEYMSLILKNCIFNEHTHCLTWQKAKHDGYGHMSYTYRIKMVDHRIEKFKKFIPAHRLMYAVTVDFLNLLDHDSSHLQVSHLCHNKLCCNIEHLEVEDAELNNSRTRCKNHGYCMGHDPKCILNG